MKNLESISKNNELYDIKIINHQERCYEFVKENLLEVIENIIEMEE